MLIPLKQKNLAKTIQTILNQPKQYGLKDDSVSIEEFVDTIYLFEEWFWLEPYDIETILQEQFECYNNRVKILTNALSYPLKYTELLPDILFLPLPLTHDSIKLYPSLKIALLIAGHRTLDLEQVSIQQFITYDLLNYSIDLKYLGLDVVIAESISLDLGQPVTDTQLNDLRPDLYLDIMLHELLYLTDEGYQSNACRYLYNTLPQIKVEKKLIPYLTHSDPDVRANSCFGLSFPVYSAGVYLNEPMPSWESLTEPYTLAPKTISSILEMMAQETNLYVLEMAIGTLKGQNYTGKLQNIRSQVMQTLEKISSRIQDEQTIKDVERLMATLVITDLREKYSQKQPEQKSPTIKNNSLNLQTTNHFFNKIFGVNTTKIYV